MNALNVTVVGQLGRVEDLNSRSDVNNRIRGSGEGIRRWCRREVLRRHDCRGLLQQDRVHQGRHKVLNMIEHSPHTTIALTTGLALGGGLELALSCDYRVGTEKTMLRFPETSIGIY